MHDCYDRIILTLNKALVLKQTGFFVLSPRKKNDCIMKLKTLQILNILGLAGVILINYLANAMPIGGNTTGELSGLYPSLFTPVAFTFAIWGLIYLLLLLFVIYQSRELFHPKISPRLRFLYRIDVWFFVSSVANISWIFVWHYQVVWLSVVIMLILLGALLVIYFRLGIGRRIVGQGERFFVHLPFSVYLGWITVATIANIAAFLVKINWDGFGQSAEFWTALMIGVASAITMVILIMRKDLYFTLVILWAFFGILYKRLTVDPQQSLAIWITAVTGIFLITSLAIFFSIKPFLKVKD